ncbi:hypothetical protein CHISP_1763 [Chitinispirillum alkaliphilum]|nr:hypothetical protein CHISP_1763 [Chitinispirillum alkaliphilum]
MQGVYSQDQTIEISGSAELPIEICSAPDSEVTIEGGCWYFYDVSDVVVSDLIFRNSQHGSLSIIGNCRRNRFHNIRFLNCGNLDKATCTVFFGGAGARFNMFEQCVFEHVKRERKDVDAANASIAVMISDGDSESSLQIKNHILRRNTFRNFDYGIIVGSGESSDYSSGHIIEYNKIENCGEDGILVKAGDTQVRGNLVSMCRANSISIAAGVGSVVEDNRVVDGYRGILISDSGHTLVNNCIVRCSKEAVRASGKSDAENRPATNLFIQENTIIKSHQSSATIGNPEGEGIFMESGATCIVEKNLVYGAGDPYKIEHRESPQSALCVLRDNVCCGGGKASEGFSCSEINFSQMTDDDFRNSSGYGAVGVMLTPETFDPHMDETSGEVDYIRASVLEGDDGELIIPDDSDEEKGVSFLNEDLLGLEEIMTDFGLMDE